MEGAAIFAGVGGFALVELFPAVGADVEAAVKAEFTFSWD